MSMPTSPGISSRTITTLSSECDIAAREYACHTLRIDKLDVGVKSCVLGGVGEPSIEQLRRGITSRRPVLASRTGILRLPYEIMSYIVKELSLDTIYDLSQACRHFQYLIREENICKMLLKVKASYSKEASEALQDDSYYARALRRLVKRRRAIAQASPFAVSIIGVADAYALYNGKLLYIVGDRLKRYLRILDLQNATNQEIVVYIPALVTQALPESEGCRKYVFRTLYHAAGITSCLYSFARPATQNWLLVFNARENQLIVKIQLDSTIRLFVRNNSDYLIFGTHSEYDAVGTRKWVLQHYNLRTLQLSGYKMHLPNLAGYEIGSAVCFEIFDKYFYGCSNQSSFELEEIDWTSYYNCFRLPLDNFENDSIQTMKKRQAFRRQHSEGPIDDRWTILALEQDEETGAVKIVESRREWLNGGSENIRSHYTKEVVFPDNESGVDGDANDPLPVVPIAGLLRSHDRPTYLNTKRPPHEQHAGDLGSPMFPKSKTYLSLYLPMCKTFVDLVNDPLPDTPYSQRLRIRAGRKPCDTNSIQHSPHVRQPTREDILEAAKQNIISCWPPDSALPKNKSHADMLERVDQVMNPPKFRGDVTAAGDERSIIYSTSSAGSGTMKVLVYISFDPAVRLSGMIRAGCLHAEIISGNGDDIGAQCDPVVQKGGGKEAVLAIQCNSSIGNKAQTASTTTSSPLLSIHRSAKQDLQPINIHSPAEGVQWVTIEEAMHQKVAATVAAKYGFAFEKSQDPGSGDIYSDQGYRKISNQKGLE